MATATMDLFAGIELREQGLYKAASTRNELLNQVRAHLELVASARYPHTADADDVEAFLLSIGKTSRDFGNAAGQIFRYKSWEWVMTKQSERKSNHARRISVWRLHDSAIRFSA